MKKSALSTFLSLHLYLEHISELIVFAFSDILYAENSKLSAESRLQQLQLSKCMQTLFVKNLERDRFLVTFLRGEHLESMPGIVGWWPVERRMSQNLGSQQLGQQWQSSFSATTTILNQVSFKARDHLLSFWPTSSSLVSESTDFLKSSTFLLHISITISQSNKSHSVTDKFTLYITNKYSAREILSIKS